MSAIVLHFDDQREPAARFASALGALPSPIGSRRFPDGESLVRLPVPLPPRAIVFCTLGRPNERLVELMLAARTARRHGAAHLTLVAPYLCYMRQDIEFNPGEAVSQTIVGEFLAGLFDAVLTVDPHLHRIDTLAQAIPVGTPVAASAAASIAAFVASAVPDAVLVGPDEESAQWVARVAADARLPHAVCVKQRFGDRDVRVEFPQAAAAASLPAQALRGRRVVLVDDIASSGQTLIQAAHACLGAGAASVDAVVTHALCGDADIAAMTRAGIARLWSTDSLEHPSNAIALAALLADCCRAHGLD
jgi:ribose-phosphate pyrophosphokinase